MFANGRMRMLVRHSVMGAPEETYIQELKTTHGIDYDSHGSYRFVDRLGAQPPQSRR